MPKHRRSSESKASDDGELLLFEKSGVATQLGGEGDLSDSTVSLVKPKKSIHPTKKPGITEPPKPVNRDGMGRYVPPFGGKPLSAFDLPHPGPTDYQPNYTPVLHSMPMWSLGGDIQEPTTKKKVTPAPNAYDTRGDANWGRCKKFTMKNPYYPNVHSDRYPGPADYTLNRSLSTGPKFSLKHRNRNAPDFAPGLVNAAYFPADQQLPGPKFNISPEEWLQRPQSFGIKHAPETLPPGPGPQNYYPEIKPSGPKWTIRHKEKPLTSPPKPGPQAYGLKSTIGNAPKFSIGHRLPLSQSRFITPGPDTYNSAGIRLDEPGYTLKYRWFEPRPEKRPGPYVVSDEAVKKKTPAYTMSSKTPLTYPCSVYSRFKADGPAPNQYKVPRDPLKKGKSFSIKSKQLDYQEGPGPADYQSLDLSSVTAKRAPAFSIAGKWSRRRETGPGPQDYEVKYPNKINGKTFGMRTNDKGRHDGTELSYDPVDLAKVCRPCQFLPGPTLKSRHTPHKHLGMKDNAVIPPAPKDFPTAPLFG